MSPKLVLILAVLNLVGCSESAKQVVSGAQRAVGVPVAASKPPLTDAEQIARLRKEAHRQGLRWSVECTASRNPQYKYVGFANYKSEPRGAYYAEDGAQPSWIVLTTTEAEAVESLYAAIMSAPNYIPEHRPEEKKKCSRVLRGE